MKETKLSGGVTATTAYTYDANNRLLSEALDVDGDLAVEKTTRYEYGPNANPSGGVGGDWTALTKETAWSAGGAQLSQVDYTYDAQGRLKTVATDSNYNGYVEVMDTYGYDENGIRVSKETWQNEADDGDSGEYHTYKTRFLNDNNNATGYAQVLEEWNASGMGALSRWYVIGQTVLGQGSSNVAYLLADGHGSTRATLTSTSAWVVETYDFDAYGNFLIQPMSTQTNLLFDGQMRDKGTGLYYMRARYYDPTTGRFNSLDPAAGNSEDPISLHKYLYAGANPVMYSDPSGREFDLNSTMTSISTAASTFLRSVGFRAASAFATGGSAVGRLWNFLHDQACIFARQVFSLFPQLVVRTGAAIQNRIIDFSLTYGNKIANFEVKYKLPEKGPQFERLVGQMTQMASLAREQGVVWTLKEQTYRDLLRLQDAVGPTVFARTQFVQGVDGLYRWVMLYFGLSQ